MLLQCQSLHVGYSHGFSIPKSIHFSIEEGHCWHLKGSNGSGKSTLFKTLLGSLPVMSGSVTWQIPKDQIGWMPQEIDTKLTPVTAWEWVAFSRPKGYTQVEIEQVFTQLGLSEFSSKRLDQLSGGQRRKAFLARVLIQSPKLILLDEPFTNLDKSSSEEFRALLKALNQDKGIALFFTDHQATTLPTTHTLDLDQLSG